MSRGKGFDRRNLRLRFLSALVLAPTVFCVFWIGGGAALVLISLACAVLALEWADMSGKKAKAQLAGLITAAVLIPIFALYAFPGQYIYCLVLITTLSAALIAKGCRWSERAFDVAFGIAYLTLPSLTLLWLRRDLEGRFWVSLVFTSAWAADAMAFFAGTILRGPKLWPSISPNKTWSGLLSGLLGAVLAAFAIAWLMRKDIFTRPLVIGGLGLMIGLATMGGDILESLLKRRFGVKNSGDIIPGHGGLLDRVDGLMFAILMTAVLRFFLPSHLLSFPPIEAFL